MKLKSTENWNDQCFFLAYFILNREVYLQKKKKKKKQRPVKLQLKGSISKRFLWQTTEPRWDFFQSF